jgi:hypothetical protein
MRIVKSYRANIMGVIAFGSMAIFTPAGQAQQSTAQNPKFTDYPVSIMKGKKAPLILNKDDRMYRTRYRLLHESSSNFAGHYAVTGVGCGGGCIFVLGVDLKTGKTTSFDLPVGEELSACDESYADANGEMIEKDLWYKADSRLFVVTGRMPNLECGARYFVEKNGKMIALLDIPISKTK